MGVADHRGDGIDDGLRDDTSDFGRKPAEVIAFLSAEGDRIISVVVDAVAGPDLTIMALARRNASLVLVVGSSPKLKVLRA